MDSYSISQVASRTGFPASTLRFYEQSGLVRPGRTPSGYRSYGDAHFEQLSFISRAKQLGLTLDEITELMALLLGEQCAPVRSRLRDLVDDKIAEAQRKIVELEQFTSQLRRAAESLNAPAPDGPCDERCGCITDPAALKVDVTLGATRRTENRPGAALERSTS